MEEHSVVDMPQFLVPEFMGRALYGIFTIVMVIVLLNMLIAMITNSFQKIEVVKTEDNSGQGKKRKERNRMQGVKRLLCHHYCLVLRLGTSFPLQALNFLVCRLRVLMMLLFLSDTSPSAHSTLGLGESVCCGRVGRNMRSEREGDG